MERQDMLLTGICMGAILYSNATRCLRLSQCNQEVGRLMGWQPVFVTAAAIPLR